MKTFVLTVLLISGGCALAQQRPDPVFDAPRPNAARLTAEAKAIDAEVERAYWTATDDDTVRQHLDELHGTLNELQILAASPRYSEAQCAELLTRLRSADILGKLNREGLIAVRVGPDHTVGRVQDDLTAELGNLADAQKAHIPVPLPPIQRVSF